MEAGAFHRSAAVFGQNIQSTEADIMQGIAVVYQELSNIPILSVVENMYLGNEIKKGMFIDWAQERKSARAALDYVGLTDIELDAPMPHRIRSIAAR